MVAGYIHCKDVTFVFYFASSALDFIIPAKSKNTYYISCLLQNSYFAGIHTGRLGCWLFKWLRLCSIEWIQIALWHTYPICDSYCIEISILFFMLILILELISIPCSSPWNSTLLSNEDFKCWGNSLQVGDSSILTNGEVKEGIHWKVWTRLWSICKPNTMEDLKMKPTQRMGIILTKLLRYVCL